MADTPGLPFPPWLPSGQVTAEAVPSFQTDPAAFVRKPVKFWVVPELSDRRAIVIFVDGSFTPGLSVAIAASFHVLMSPWKISARVAAVNFNGFVTPDRLYDTVMGAVTVGRYRNEPPLIFARSADGYG